MCVWEGRGGGGEGNLYWTSICLNGVTILLFASCSGNKNKLQQSKGLGTIVDFTCTCV